jgi:hypothetical protein
MSTGWKSVLGLTGWGLAAYGALCVARIPGDFGHSLCGPWGCLPPLQALAAMHLLWVVVLLPVVAWALARWPGRPLAFAGKVLFGLSLVTIVVAAGWDLLVWLPSTPAGFHPYWARRCLFTLLMLSDIPLFQGLCAGAACWAVGAWRARPRKPAPAGAAAPAVTADLSR